jgi:histone deacetylase 6
MFPSQDALELYAVEPLPYCPHLEQVEHLPEDGLNTEAECVECGMVGENWVCLTCYEVSSGIAKYSKLWRT